jgi:glycine/D-amino acid oxidase-like deaminating enzyme
LEILGLQSLVFSLLNRHKVTYKEWIMSNKTADIVICGAGVAGLATAYHLAVRQGIKQIVIVDERHPLSLTSDKSSECYRNWWPGPGPEMIRLMNRSIDLLEELAVESDNFFDMNRRGYVFLTADPHYAQQMKDQAETISQLGAGPLRTGSYQPAPAEGYTDQPTGADFMADTAGIHHIFPFLTEDVCGMLHPRRCGWLSAQQLGIYLLRQAQAQGAELVKGRVTEIEIVDGRIHTIHIQTSSGLQAIQTRHFVNAAGPLQRHVGQMMGVDIPVFCEMHHKIAFADHLNIVPRHVPMMIWEDPIALPWSEAEQTVLAEDESTRYLLQPFPGGVHFRPEGGRDSTTLIALWTYHLDHLEVPVWPPPRPDPNFTDIVLRGLARMIPGLSVYFERMNKPFIDGGYYCKTRENRPLACPLPVEGAYLTGALSGFGIMACLAVAELTAAYISHTSLPGYAPAFHPDRYQDAAYQKLLATWEATSGQL